MPDKRVPCRGWFIHIITSPSVKIRTKEDRVQNPSLQQKATTIEQDVSNETERPKYPSANVRPSEGFVLEIDGKFGSEYGTLMGALKAGLELRQKFPHSLVKVHEANEQT
jgi:hypothetical protein